MVAHLVHKWGVPDLALEIGVYIERQQTCTVMVLNVLDHFTTEGKN
jgi:hypothetical protein